MNEEKKPLTPEEIAEAFDAETDGSANNIEIWARVIREYGEQQREPLLKEIERLEGVISEARYNLPTECPVCEEFGYDDVKFCHFRNGEGNNCLKCIR